ncbi:Chemotaxis protein methyltransferase [Aquisphaera giovannonii]|uniref:protein-glutamate O-methyltransferase n=1 Tax=Aquisphaera giovannonii TaxID=406548 RepID=A0A5B9VVA9_9BACT|nr:protein-glutamate O-methyltransferase CheR [Aquisphaera giovannonii]QEH31781.1 Chemotaxis protein methyltransferase [Aquisphaera giovannonii]
MSADELTEDEFRRFCSLIYRSAGIRIADNKRVLIANRVRRRLRATGIDAFSAYYAFITSPAGAAEMPLFLDAITTNETYFYRDPQHYAWLAGEFLPGLAERARRHTHTRSVRIWSAACSTGEEPYSIALKALAARPILPGWKVHIVGTDLSGAVLASAKAGVYDDRAVHLVPDAERKKYFDEDAESRPRRWTVKGDVRSLVTWKLHNLMLPLREDPFDCIFLKNVLIYFDAESKKAVVRNVLAAMAKDAYLVVGPTEGIYTMLDPLTKVKPWLYQKQS